MKELRKMDLFNGGTLLGYRTDDSVMHVIPHYDKQGAVDYVRVETLGTGNHAIIAIERLDEVLKMLLTVRKDVTQQRV